MAKHESMTVTIDKFGRVLIPKHVRTRIGLQAGDQLELEVSDAERSVALHPTAGTKTAVTRIEMTDWGWPVLVTDPPMTVDFDVVEMIRQGREERADKVLGLKND